MIQCRFSAGVAGLFIAVLLYNERRFCNNSRMAISSDILATVCEMSRKQDVSRPSTRHSERPVGPTPERMAKPDYSGAQGSRKKCRNLLSLRNSGDLDSEGETVAERWRGDYEFSEYGHADFMRDPLPDDYIKGDAITFGLGRAHAGARVSIVREIIGDGAHSLLVRAVLLDESFTSIARDYMPGLDRVAGSRGVRQRLAQLLLVLPSVYMTARKMQDGAKI